MIERNKELNQVLTDKDGHKWQVVYVIKKVSKAGPKAFTVDLVLMEEK